MLNNLYHSLNPIAFSIGDMTVKWYGLAYLFGFIFAGLILVLTAKKWRIVVTFEKLLFGILLGILGVIIGARLGYCIFYGDGYYFSNPIKILAINEGGMSFHGGLIGGLVFGILPSRICGVRYLRLLDLAFIGVPLGLLFGRCANFINGELWGAPTDLPWGVNFGYKAGNIFRHPSQLYEAFLEGLVIFVVLFYLSRRKNAPQPRGTYFALFCIMYAIFRFVVEFVRVPDAQLGYIAWGWLTMGQILSIPVFVVGVVLLFYSQRVIKLNPLYKEPDSSYTKKRLAFPDRFEDLK